MDLVGPPPPRARRHEHQDWPDENDVEQALKPFETVHGIDGISNRRRQREGQDAGAKNAVRHGSYGDHPLFPVSQYESSLHNHSVRGLCDTVRLP